MISFQVNFNRSIQEVLGLCIRNVSEEFCAVGFTHVHGARTDVRICTRVCIHIKCTWSRFLVRPVLFAKSRNSARASLAAVGLFDFTSSCVIEYYTSRPRQKGSKTLAREKQRSRGSWDFSTQLTLNAANDSITDGNV